MSKYIKDLNQTQQNIQSNSSNVVSNSGVQKYSAGKEKIAAVKSKITVPMYFYNIIVPQLGSYFDLYPVDFSRDPRACCPLHDEDTPSFRYYEETNSFYCFGCQRGGDVVALHRYFAERSNGYKPTYEEAIGFLYSYFIEGKETVTFIDQSTQTIDGNKKENTDIEVVRFNIYRKNLEASITFDQTILFSVKEQLWEELDNIDLLLSLDKIKATEAKQYLQNKVKELLCKESFLSDMKPKSKVEQA